jgi:hypothetical protein
MAAFSELSGSQAQLETISTIMDEKISAAAEIYGCVNPSLLVFFLNFIVNSRSFAKTGSGRTNVRKVFLHQAGRFCRAESISAVVMGDFNLKAEEAHEYTALVAGLGGEAAVRDLVRLLRCECLSLPRRLLYGCCCCGCYGRRRRRCCCCRCRCRCCLQLNSTGLSYASQT